MSIITIDPRMKTYIQPLYFRRAHQLAMLLTLLALLVIYRPAISVAAAPPPPSPTAVPTPHDPLAAALRPAFAGDVADAMLPR